MVEWLRTLSPPLRYSVYAGGGVLLIRLIAVGVGAKAAIVVSWQFEPAATGTVDTGNARTTTPQGSELKTTGPARASDGTAIEPSTDSRNSNDAAYKATLVHRATEKNSRGDYTFISAPGIDGHASDIVLTSPTSDQKNIGTASYKHNICAWYAPAPHQWAIFNEDRAPVPAGATFEVIVPPASAKLVHHADLSNTAGNYTYLDNRLTNGKPDAVLSVTQGWNPGGGRGVYNNHPLGVLYDSEVEKWAVYDRDRALIPVEPPSTSPSRQAPTSP